MGAAETIRDYYGALSDGEPLGPYFADDDAAVKFGISEALRGHDEIVAALREQTETTTDWAVESRDLVVGERDGWAWFGDDVFMAWTDTGRDVRHEFDTRWSGALERRAGWRFVAMHVSTPGEL
jgi:hypothetical protein